MLSELYAAAPALPDALRRHPLLTDSTTLWNAARRLLTAHAPSGGAWLPGAIVDAIRDCADELGLADRFIPAIGSTGNAGLWLGVNQAAPDLVIVAHMDRPTFKVRSEAAGTLYPICANRFPNGRYEVRAKSLRFEDGKLTVGARGLLVSERGNVPDRLTLKVDEGRLAWHDLVVMDVEPTLQGDTITGTGLDNSLGVLTALGAAAALKPIETGLIERGRRCLFVFSDQEEGIPDAYFGHGAHRLTYAVPPPTLGCIVVDTQTTGPDTTLAQGRGAGHGGVSAWSRGSVVPPNALALAIDLSAEMNAARPNTIQLNTGYLSRSDDMPLGRWTQILAMIGPPMTDAHTGHETATLSDIPSAIAWLSHFAAAALGLVPEIARAYALERP